MSAWKDELTRVSCDCPKCKGTVVELPASIAAQTSAHKAVALATHPAGIAVNARVIERKY